MADWETRWRRRVRKTRLPGVWELRGGGYLVRAKRRGQDGKLREVQRVLHHVQTADEARKELLVLLRTTQASQPESRPLFAEYAGSLLARRIRAGLILSPATVEKWRANLEHHLLPEFGHRPMDSITHKDVLVWIEKLEVQLHEGAYMARTVNGWIRNLKTIFKVASPYFGIPNPTDGISQFPETDRTHTHERPNALPPELARAFMERFKRDFPQHYPMVLLMLVTGLRPSSLRPLRRKGPDADYDSKKGLLAVRRSYVTQKAMDQTKTKKDQVIHLPRPVCDVLDAHVRGLTGAMAESELLFPGTHGGFRSRSCLDKPLRTVALAVGIKFPLTPKAFRRSFKNYTRRNNVSRVVERSLSGHQTEEMDHVYGFPHADEQVAVLNGILVEAGIGRQAEKAHACEPDQGAPECISTGRKPLPDKIANCC